MQLLAYGAPDTYLFANGREATPFNIRDSMANYWFVDQDDGFATLEDCLGKRKIIKENVPANLPLPPPPPPFLVRVPPPAPFRVRADETIETIENLENAMRKRKQRP